MTLRFLCRHVLTASVMVGLLAGGASFAFGQAADPAESDSEQAADARYQAARADERHEQERIATARDRYEEERQSSPQVPRRYTVSFDVPVLALDLLKAARDNPDIVLETVHVWMEPEGLPHAATMHQPLMEMRWPLATPDQISGDLRQVALEYLLWKTDMLDRATRELKEPSARRAAGQQRAAAAQLRQRIEREGVLLYGVHCTCSPSSLDSLKTRVGGLAYRAVELRDHHEEPIWPYDRLRELVVQTGGQYGR